MPGSKTADLPSVELALLALLRGHPMHGYALHRLMADPSGPGQVWDLRQSQIYALLGRLEGTRLLKGEAERIGARPPRRVFSLTRDGERAVSEWLTQPVPHARLMRQDFLVKLYFARRQGGGEAARLIEAQRAACQDWLAVNQDLAARDAEGSYDAIVRGFRAGQIEAMLDWLDRCARAEVRRGRAGEPDSDD